MSFTKSELIGQAYLRISGGQPNTDSSVHYGEMETYLAMAVNYVQTGNYYIETRAEGEKTINPLLYTVFPNIPIQTDSVSSRKYIDLTKNVITLTKGRGLTVMTLSGKTCYPLTQGDEALEQFYGKYKTWISYQIEGQLRVWLYNVPAMVTELNVKQIVHVQDLADDDLVILPSDGDAKVVDMMCDFFMKERTTPKDYIVDSTDTPQMQVSN